MKCSFFIIYLNSDFHILFHWEWYLFYTSPYWILYVSRSPWIYTFAVCEVISLLFHSSNPMWLVSTPTIQLLKLFQGYYNLQSPQLLLIILHRLLATHGSVCPCILKKKIFLSQSNRFGSYKMCNVSCPTHLLSSCTLFLKFTS